MQANLKEIGYKLVLINSLSEFIKLTYKTIPSAIIVDEHYLTSKQLKEAIKFSQFYPIHVLCLGEHDNVKTRLKAIRLGMTLFLTKAVDLFYLTNRIVQLCGLSEREDYTVLIVDDSEVLAQYYALILKEAGMHAHTITKPLEILKALEQYKPHLLLMDLYLPECTGFELAKIIRQDERYLGLPIIFISTEDDRYKQLSILNSCGGDDFLTKPVLPQNLVAAIKSRAQRSAMLVSHIVRDSLTQLLDHSHVLAQLEYEILRAQRQKQMVSVAMIDLDHFKKINDKHGHPTGDLVLKWVADFLSANIRRSDCIGRYGGEEFCIIFPNTSIESAIKLCNKLRQKFAGASFAMQKKKLHLTLSMGLADYPRFDTKDSIIAAADRALYQAKSNGRNKVAACVSKRSLTKKVARKKKS